LAPLLEELLFDPERLEQMSKAAFGLARPGAAAELAGWVLELARGGDG
jgi:UDP-N-acetylglucosamine:LPS N-acetylglucosamine transferase